MHHDPAQRFANVAELARSLQAYAQPSPASASHALPSLPLTAAKQAKLGLPRPRASMALAVGIAVSVAGQAHAAPVIDSTVLKGGAVAGRQVELRISASDRSASLRCRISAATA